MPEAITQRVATPVSGHHPVEVQPPDIAKYRQGNTAVDYVHVLDSGRAGPTVMVQALTHGNEFTRLQILPRPRGDDPGHGDAEHRPMERSQRPAGPSAGQVGPQRDRASDPSDHPGRHVRPKNRVLAHSLPFCNSVLIGKRCYLH